MKPIMWLFLLVFLITAPWTCEAQWRWLYPSLRGEFRSCVMASADHAYILTASDSVLETRDQGRTWTTMEVDGLPTFGIFFRPSRGFLVVRDRGEGAVLQSTWHLLKTTDGGQSWHRLPTTFGDVVDVYFGTDSLGWVTLRTGEGFHTTDGGQTWELNAPGTPPFIRWMDRNTWYGYRHYSTNYGHKDSVLWYSFDGGATWEQRKLVTPLLTVNPRYTVYSECLSLTHLSSGALLAMLSAHIVYPKMQTSFTWMNIARSIDTGRTWSWVYKPHLVGPMEEVSYEPDPPPRSFPLRFLTIQDSVITIVTDYGKGWSRSSDGGNTWSGTDTLSDNSAYLGIDSDHMGSVLSVSSSRRRIQWSTDAGGTWILRDDTEVFNTIDGPPLLSVHSSGLVIGDYPHFATIAKTGSLVFNEHMLPPVNMSIDYIVDYGPCRSIDDHRILLAKTGLDSFQLVEVTNSKDWIPITAPFQPPTSYLTRLGSSYSLGSGRAVITASNGVMYSHNEDTQEWRGVDSANEAGGPLVSNHHLKFFSRDQGINVVYMQGAYTSSTGLDSLLYNLYVRTTSDGGRSWTRIPVPLKQFIQFVPLSLANRSALAILNIHTYLTGNPDGIRKTTDWGRTWTLVCPTTEGIRYISEVDSLRVFATTEHELLGTKDGGHTWSRIIPRDASGRILSAGRFTKVFTTPSGFVLACLPDGFIGGMADSILTGVDRTEPVLPLDPLRIYPNPGISGSEIRVQFSQTKAGPSSLTLYSSLGLRLHHETLSDREPGIRDVPLRTRSLAPGLYFITVSTPEGVRVGKMVVIRNE